MTVTELLAELTRQGVQVSADGGDLTVRAPKGVLTPSLRAALTKEKTEILALLRQAMNGDQTRLQIVPVPQDRHMPFPLTDMQQAYWIGRTAALELGRVACQVYLEMESASLNVPRLNQAWQRLIDRHDMLRAIVRPDGQQQILSEVPPYLFEILDFTGREPGSAASELERIRQEMSHRVTNADQWPLFEIRATRLPSGRTRLHFRIELTIADAWSVIFLLRGWFQLYVDPDQFLPLVELSFRDYVLAEIAAQDSDAYRRAEQYWLSRLPALPPAPELPLAQNPASIQQPRFERRSAELDPARWQRLKARAAGAGLTPSGVLCAAFAEVLSAWSKTPDFNLNLTFFNRPPIHPQLKDVIGDFTSTILLEVHNSDKTFEARARRLQDQLRKDLEYSQYSGVRVLRELHRARGGAITATAPIVFTSGLSIRSGDEPPTDYPGEIVYSISQTPQVWLDHQTFERAGALLTSWDSVDALFPAGLLDEMFTAYCRLLDRLASDEESWHETIRRVVPIGQLRQREAINATSAPIPEGLLHTLFAAQAIERPMQPAVISRERVLTYEELSHCAHRLGRRLQHLGARPNSLVAVVLEKGWEQVAAVLGILESGAAYLPIDPDLPRERVRYLLENGRVDLVLTHSRLDRELAWPDGIQRLCVDDEAFAEGDAPALAPVQGPQDLAYVIYTSGSTGLPKGVMIDHRGAVNTIVDINRRFGAGPEDRVLALSALSFDLSVYDIFGTLAAGGTIVIPEPAESRNPAHWAELMRNHRVTIWNSVPALLQMLVEFAVGAGDVLPRSLRLALLSGDWIPVTLPGQARALVDGLEIISLGGATEASIWSILYPIGEIDPARKSIPYGRPMVNQQFQVLNAALEPCPVWAPGQLYIGGIGLAVGYWGDEEKTQASFLVHPHTGQRLYRTGDWGRYLPDGNIEFLGREDFQVKVGGHRIELGEIEAALAQHPAVRAGVVVAAGEPQGNRRLVAYVVADRPQSPAGVNLPADFQLPSLEGILLDPIERLEFKLGKPGLRKPSTGEQQILLTRPDVDEAAYAARRSYRAFLQQPIALQQLSELLSCLLHVHIEGAASRKARYGSAGSLYPVQTYLYVKPNRVEGLAAGTYYYHPHDHTLILLWPDAYIDGSVHVPTNRALVDASAFSIFLIAQMNAIQPMYGEYARHYAAIEAGLMTQLLEMSAPAQHVGLCQMGGLEFQRVRHLFSLDDGHVLLHSLVGGGIEPRQMETAALREPATAMASETPAEMPLVAELRNFLRTKVAGYMVPSAIVLLDALPLTSNGKADRKALLSLGIATPQTAAPYIAPRNELERTIASVVRQVLHLEQVGVHQSFFELGANSVELVQVHRELRNVLQRELPVVEIFKYPTISALAEYLGQTTEDTAVLEESQDRASARREALRQRRQRPEEMRDD